MKRDFATTRCKSSLNATSVEAKKNAAHRTGSSTPAEHIVRKYPNILCVFPTFQHADAFRKQIACNAYNASALSSCASAHRFSTTSPSKTFACAGCNFPLVSIRLTSACRIHSAASFASATASAASASPLSIASAYARSVAAFSFSVASYASSSPTTASSYSALADRAISASARVARATTPPRRDVAIRRVVRPARVARAVTARVADAIADVAVMLARSIAPSSSSSAAPTSSNEETRRRRRAVASVTQRDARRATPSDDEGRRSSAWRATARARDGARARAR